jgi:small subunit ribosomal protein S2
MTNFIYSQLVRVGAHIGARAKNFWFLASWMVLGIAKNCCVLDLQYSLLIFKLSFSVLRSTVFFKAPIWFVNLDKTKEDAIMTGALLCGEFFCNKYWISGVLSNYFHVFMMLRKFINTPFFLRSKQLVLKLAELVEYWFLTRFTWPRLLFVSSAFYNRRVIREALRTGIPCIVITDTLYTTDYMLFPIPGNDQSVSAIEFYNHFIASVVLRLKFVNMICWFINIRQTPRLILFNEWVNAKISEFQTKGLKKKFLTYSYSLIGKKFIAAGISLGFMRSGSYDRQYLFYFDMNISDFNAQTSFLQFIKVQYILQGIEDIFFTKIWLKTGLFGIKRIRRRTKRFFCKSPKRLGIINFLQSRTDIPDLENSGCYTYMIQGILLMSFLKYYDFSYFKRFKKIGWKFFKKLRQSIFLIMGTFFIFKAKFNFKQNSKLQFFTILLKVKLAIVNFDDDITLHLLKVRKDNLWFWTVANLRFNCLWPITSELHWFFIGYLYNLKLPRRIQNFLLASFNYNWNVIYSNLWWWNYVLESRIVSNRNRLAVKQIKKLWNHYFI